MWEEDCSTQVQTWMLVMWVVCTCMLVCVCVGFVLCSPFPRVLPSSPLLLACAPDPSSHWCFLASSISVLSSLLCSVMVPVDAAEPGSAAYSPSSERLLLPAVQISVSTELIYGTQLIVGAMTVISPVQAIGSTPLTLLQVTITLESF